MFFDLTPVTSIKRKVFNILLVLLAVGLWTWFSFHLYNTIRPKTMQDIAEAIAPKEPVHFHWFDLVYGVIWAPLWEELFFRWAPLNVVKKIGTQFLLPTMIISSVLFGTAHDFGAISISQQGVGGFMLCWLHIKNNYSYWSTFIVHLLWNASVFYFIPLLTQ